MANFMLRPDLRTAGGEVNDILVHGHYAGTLTLVYREGERVSGSIQLEKESLSKSDKREVIHFVQNYVESLVGALRAKECDVLVTYSKYDHMIATGNNIGTITGFVDEDEEEAIFSDELMEQDEQLMDYHDEFMDQDDEDSRLEDFDPTMDPDDIQMIDDGDAAYYELMIVDEKRNKIQYHVYDQHQELVAEAFMKIYGGDVVGDVNWSFDPSEDEIEHVTDLIVSDFDSNEIDSFIIDMKYENEVVETIELTHEDLLEDMEPDSATRPIDDISVVLVRDDGDTLTYEIYGHRYGGLPIGSATVDISRRAITGFIDFRDPANEEDREIIATALMRELDKEKEYESVNLTMLYKNEPIDELLFETEHIH